MVYSRTIILVLALCFCSVQSASFQQRYDPRCPVIGPDQVGICSVCEPEYCLDGQICCPNGCGSSCTYIADPKPIKIQQRYDPRCPAVLPGQIGICLVCQQEYCVDGQICCPNGCGSNCMDIADPKPIKTLPDQCPENMVYSDCAGCTVTCDDIGKLVTCPPICLQQCTCKPGYYLHGETCLTETECKALQ